MKHCCWFCLVCAFTEEKGNKQCWPFHIQLRLREICLYVVIFFLFIIVIFLHQMVLCSFLFTVFTTDIKMFNNFIVFFFCLVIKRWHCIPFWMVHYCKSAASFKICIRYFNLAECITMFQRKKGEPMRRGSLSRKFFFSKNEHEMRKRALWSNKVRPKVNLTCLVVYVKNF